MSTMMVPSPPEVDQLPEVRFLTVRANLLPDEVLESRRVRRVRKVVLFAIVATVGLMAAWAGVAFLQTTSANADLHSAETQSTLLTQEQSHYASLVQAQEQASAIDHHLATLMAYDIDWAKFDAEVMASVTRGTVITAFQADANVPSPGTAAAPLSSTATDGVEAFNTTGATPIGTVHITATATTLTAFTALLNSLDKVPGITAMFPADVTRTQGIFTANAVGVLTSAAEGGRWTSTGSN